MTDPTTDAPEEEAVAASGVDTLTDPQPIPVPAPATEAVAAEEPKTCAQCGEPAVYTSPADNVMDEASFCARHKPVNAPKK